MTFLKEKVGGSGRSIKRSIDLGGAFVNGKCERFSSKRLRVGDLVEFKTKEAQKGALEIVFEDDDLIVYNKPPGHVCSDLNQVHRLDRMTSGLYLVSKNNFTKSELEKQFYDRSVEKTYLALLCGSVEMSRGVIDDPIGKIGSFDGQTMWGTDPHGMKALTAWEKVAEFGGMTLVACFPKTGRTHQLRVHLASIGHPIVGDHQYCRKRFPIEVDRMMLHAYALCFTHPRTGERMQLGGDLARAKKLAQDIYLQSGATKSGYLHSDVPRDFIDALSRGSRKDRSVH